MDDDEAQVNRRSDYVQGVERNTVQKIQVLHDRNVLVHKFKMAKDKVTSNNYKVMIHPVVYHVVNTKNDSMPQP